MVLGLEKRLGKSNRMKTAVGPFSPEFFKALKEGSCMNCGTGIDGLTFFGNALVVESKKVVTRCLKCREGEVETVNRSLFEKRKQHTTLDNLDRDGVIFHIHQHTFSDSGELMEWIDVLLKLRLGYAHFQKMFDTADAFRTGYWESVYGEYGYDYESDRIYGDLLAIGNCGECGAYWQNGVDKNLGKIVKGWDSEVCWACGLPHQMQWHMRISASEEKRILLGEGDEEE